MIYPGSRMLMVAGLLISSLAWGQPAGNPPGQNAAAAVWVDQKASLLNKILEHQTAQHATSEVKPEVKAKADQIRGLRDAAASASASGDMLKAATLLDQALREAMALSRMTADPASQLWLHRARYEDWMQGTHHYTRVYQAHLEQIKNSGAAVKPGLDVNQVTTLTEQAKNLAKENKFEEANRLLQQAHGMIVGGLKNLLDSKTLVYDLKFATPAHELQYERERGDGLESLLRLVLSQQNIGAEDKAKVQKIVEQAIAERQQSERLAATGEMAPAIKSMEKSNGLLGQALRATGVDMPM